MHLHSLPFCIGYNGPAEVDQAFPVVVNNESNTFKSAFRGRKLIGRSHELPYPLGGKIAHFLLFSSNFKKYHAPNLINLLKLLLSLKIPIIWKKKSLSSNGLKPMFLNHQNLKSKISRNCHNYKKRYGLSVL